MAYQLNPEFDELIADAERWPYVRQRFAGYLPAPRPSGLARIGVPMIEQAWERMRREWHEAAARPPLRVSVVTDSGSILLGRMEEN